MPEPSLRDRLLRLLNKRDYRPMDKVELSKALYVHSSERRKLRQILQSLESEGIVARIRKNRYVLPEEANLITGRIEFHRGGNAHVISEKAGQPDIFIAQVNAGTALHGDRVVVRLMHEGRAHRLAEPSRPEGRVIRILERVRDQIVGTLQRTDHFYYVIPDDPRIPQNLYVDLGATELPRQPNIGDKVVARLTAWESRHVNPEGLIIEVLGPATAPGVDMLSVIRKYDLPEEFPAKVIQEAESIPECVDPAEVARREDCRNQFIITIDPDDAKDFDDAILVERIPKDRRGAVWRLSVHIADVSHYVRPGTALDKEARGRGNSTYLADRVLPMLPERLSNGVCSLKPHVDRLTFAAFIDFNEKGEQVFARFSRAVIRSAARLTYRQAFAILENRPPPPTPNYERGGKVHLSAEPVPLEVTPQLRERVQTAWELASLLRKRRFAMGSLDLDFPELKVWLDDQGRATRLERVENDISHQLIEECMLAANEAVASETKHRLKPSVYRIHEQPNPDKLSEFREIAASYGFRAGNLEQRREVQKLLAAIRGAPEEYAIKLAFLKSLKRATYSTDPIGHYGLAKTNYTHFTSPIRRYADLIVHRVLADCLTGGRKPQQPHDGKRRAPKSSDLAAAAEHISRTERVSADAENESVALKKMEYFQRQLDSRRPEVFQAVVVDVRSYGILVDLPEVMTNGLIHVSDLGDDFFEFDSARLQFHGRRTRHSYKIGDRLEVIVSRVDVPKRQIDFAPASPPEPGRGRRGDSRKVRDQKRPGGERNTRGRRRR